MDAIEEFLTGARHNAEAQRSLCTVMFTDIVASTARASAVGDRAWAATLAGHDTVVQAEIERWRGRTIKHTGDGFLATFDGPARAVRCADAIVTSTRGLGLDVRVGIHTGECEVLANDVAGIAVHIAARVTDLAQPGQVLVTGTVKDLVVGSGLRLTDLGVHRLRGVPDEWRVFTVTPHPASAAAS